MKNTVLLIVAIFVSISMKSFSMEVHLKDVAISSSTSDDWGSILDSVIASNRMEITWFEDSNRIETGTPTSVLESEQTSVTSLQPRYMTPQIDYTKPVGGIPFQSDVSSLGSRIYQVPFEIPNGLNGLTPQLGLNYNSMQGNGPLGVGWDFSGLSSIVRINKSIYYDGKTDGVSADHDAFALDGQRLIRLADENGLPTYKTVQGHIRVQATAMTDSVITQFKVYYPNGNIGQFQSSDNGHLVYPLVALKNVDGNFIYYSYNCVNNRHYISSVSYNYNQYAKILFTYEERPDSICSYVYGHEIKQTTRLKKVTVKWGSTVLREYNLTYGADETTSQLIEIGCTSNGKSLNPLRFEYGTNTKMDEYTTDTISFKSGFVIKNPTNNKYLRIIKGRYEHQKKDGLIFLPNREAYISYIELSPLNIPVCAIGSQYNSGTDLIAISPDISSSNVIINTMTLGDGFADVFCIDLDGNQQEYIVKVNNVQDSGKDCLTFSVYRYSAVVSNCILQYQRTYNFGNVFADFFGNQSVRPKYFHIGDFNGDGRQDVMVLVCPAPLFDDNFAMKCNIYDLVNDSLLYSGSPFNYHPILVSYDNDNIEDVEKNSDRLFVLDYNGDGKTDVCLLNGNGTYIYEFNTSGSGITDCTEVGITSSLNKSSIVNRSFLLGEFNGDGLIDVLLSPLRNNSDTTWKLYKSTGNGEFISSTFTGSTAGNGGCDGFLVQDVNNDGITDLIKYSKSEFKTFLTINGFPTLDIGSLSMEEYSVVAPTSLTSHNFYSDLLTLKEDKLIKYSYCNDFNKQKLLTSMSDSWGNIEYTHYTYPTENSSSYTLSSSAELEDFPYIVLDEKIPFVTSSYSISDGKKTNECTYSFSNLVTHRQGLGVCGMYMTSVENERNKHTQYFDPRNHGVLIREVTDVGEKNYSYSINHPENNAIVQINLTNKSVTDNLNGFTTSSTYSYNEYGFPLIETTTTSDGITVRTNQSVNHHISSTHYMLNVVKEKVVTTTRNGLTHTEKVTYPTMYYNKPLSQYNYVNGGQVCYQTFTYGSNGLLTKNTVKNYASGNTLTTTYAYDNFGRLLKETTPEEFTKEYLYNTKGLVSSYKNELGISETYQYDAFGRKIRTNFAEGSWEQVEYSWREGAPFNVHGYAVKTTSSTGGISTTLYNTRQENVGSENYTALSKLYQYRTFDDFGNMLTETLPFKEGGTRHYNRYVYDAYDRLTRLTDASGKITTHSYDKNRVTTIQDGITTTRVYDSQGNLTSVIDSTGTLTYNLRPDGQPLSVTIPGNLSTTAEYDAFGRQTKQTDPSSGTTTFTYDADGNLASQTDGEGRQTLMEYDPYGRLIRKEYVGNMYVTYTYTNGLLMRETDSNGGARRYAYDNYGRLIMDLQTIGTADHNLSRYYTYDSNGNLTSVEYSQEYGSSAMHYGTENFSYQNGQVKKISFQATPLNNAESVIWEVTSENAQGIPSAIVSGPLTHTYSYDLQTRPLQVQTLKNGTTVRNMSYAYHPQTGNLLSRTDNTRNLQESFTYDHQNRLTGDGTETYEYDNATGNMTYNSRIGTITYGVGIRNSYQVNLIDPLTRTTDDIHLLTVQQKATYNAMSRPATLEESNQQLEFTYNGRCERNIAEFIQITPPQGFWDDTIKTEVEHRYYLSEIYERSVTQNENKVILYLGGNAYSAPAAFVQDSLFGAHMVYICRDHLGSITHLSSDKINKEYSYDAWGNLRNPDTHELYQTRESKDYLYLLRGYTGHEHLGYYGLINMNARLYEPATGRFISPDPYVQMPDYSQNYNRYTYCLNNPLKYTDESGEFIFSIFNGIKDLFINTFIKVWDQGFNAWSNADNWHSTYMAFKIDKGLFQGNFGQIVSRFTWEGIQTGLGYTFNHLGNTFNKVKSVDYYGGATVVESTKSGWGAITLGSYITGSKGIKADPYNSLFQHEYGHYLQSQKFGPLYIQGFGIPSIYNAAFGDRHNSFYTEQDANKRGLEYFSEHIHGYSYENGWNFYKNPITDYNSTTHLSIEVADKLEMQNRYNLKRKNQRNYITKLFYNLYYDE